MKTTNWILTASLLVLPLSQASAKQITDIEEIGTHQEIFRVEKNVNPENIAVVYTKVDDKCRFVTDPENRDQPVFDFYWRMEGVRYKPMASFFKNEFHRRMTFAESGADRATHFQLDANDLKEMDHDLGKSPRLDIVAFNNGAGCDVQAYMNLGPSDGNARIRLDAIYGEGRTFPPAVFAVTLKGEVVDKNGKGTGKKIAHRYPAK